MKKLVHTAEWKKNVMKLSNFILAPDSFKGTMSSDEVCTAMERAIIKNIPEAHITRVPLADGGEGLVRAFIRICGAKLVTAAVCGPLFERVNANYAILPDGTAVIEMAECAGLTLVENCRDPLHTTTFGVGELILHAYAGGCKKIILGLGGSATNDCGIGMAAALGYKFFDDSGSEIEPSAENMVRISAIKVPKSLPECSFVAACDVNNPLYGPTGATYTFGMQKGAQGGMLELLDAGLENMAAVMKRDLNVDVASEQGSGAAGGLGAGVLAFLHGALKPGIELVLEAAKFDELIEDADIVFTGEGRIDWQSAHGKAPVGVAMHAKAKGIPCIALCGSIGEGAEKVYEKGISAFFSSIRGTCDFEQLKKTCREDMFVLTDAVVRTLMISNS